jgi:hypothetical protein
MSTETIVTPFADLPAVLVEEMLKKSEELGITLHHSFHELEKKKKSFRNFLEEDNILKNYDDNNNNVTIPTTCGIDGSYAVEKLLGIDVITCAAVGIEGLIPPSETKLWEIPDHKVLLDVEIHHPDNSTTLRGIMVEMEMALAANAPHQLILLDGSFTSPLIHMNQSINKAIGSEKSSDNKLVDEFKYFMLCYNSILNPTDPNKICVSIPKYTTKKELGTKYGWPDNYDDRAILTNILLEDEYTTPCKLGRSDGDDSWHLKLPPANESEEELIKIKERILSSLDELYVFYFKPYQWSPALRIEIIKSIAHDSHKLMTVLKAIKYQCFVPTILEPYPLFIADRMVKHIPQALPAFRQTATQKMVELNDGDVSDILLGMHSYRTEGGSNI